MALSKGKRFRIFRRDNYTCVYCGRKAPEVVLEVDHRIPRCEGGSDNEENLFTACSDCNRGKGAQSALAELTPEEKEALDAMFGPDDQLRDDLPTWFTGPRGKHHVNLKFDIYAAAAELPAAVDWQARFIGIEPIETLGAI